MAPITAEEAWQLGYRVIEASSCEVGLVLNGLGIRAWWCKDFGGEMPTLNHPTILEAISLHERISQRHQTRT